MYYASESKAYMTKEDIAPPMRGIIMWIRVQIAQEIYKQSLTQTHKRYSAVHQSWWHTPVILVFEILRQKSHKFEDILIYLGRRASPKSQAKRKD